MKKTNIQNPIKINQEQYYEYNNTRLNEYSTTIVNEYNTTILTIAYLDEDEDLTTPTRSLKRRFMYLCTVNKNIYIKIQDVFDLPNTLIIQRGDSTVSSMRSNISRNIEFKIKRSSLRVGDKIILITSSNYKIVEIDILE